MGRLRKKNKKKGKRAAHACGILSREIAAGFLALNGSDGWKLW